MKGNFRMNALNKKRNPPKKEEFLKKALLEAQKSFDDAYEGLQNVSEPDLIDSYIYALNAAHLRYKVLLREVKLLQNENHVSPLDGGEAFKRCI